MANKSIFNSTNKSKNILGLLPYIENKDLFRVKLLTDLMTGYDENTKSVSFYLNYKAGHLTNYKFKQDFISVNSVIFDLFNMRPEQRTTLDDDLVIFTDNASKGLTIFYELNEMTTTITMVSLVKSPTEQQTVHVRNNLTRTHYLPIVANFYEKKTKSLPGTLYNLKIKELIDQYIKTDVKGEYKEPHTVAMASVPAPVYALGNTEIWNLLKNEAVESLAEFTGFDRRENISHNLNSNIVSVKRDEDGYYVTLG